MRPKRELVRKRPYSPPKIHCVPIFKDFKVKPWQKPIISKAIELVAKGSIGVRRRVPETTEIMRVLGPFAVKSFLGTVKLNPSQKKFLLKELSFTFGPNASMDFSHLKRVSKDINQLFDKNTLDSLSLSLALDSVHFDISLDERPYARSKIDPKKYFEFQVKHDLFYSLSEISQTLRQMAKYCEK